MPGFLLAVVLPVQFWRLHALNSQPMVPIVLLFVLAGIYSVLRGLRQKLALEPDAVTVRYAFLSRRLERHEIAGWRKSSGGARWTGLSGRTLVPRDKARKPLAFYEVKTDPAFYAWFAGIPELKPTMDTPPVGSPVKMFIAWVGIMAGFLTVLLLSIFWGDRPFGIQIVSLIADTGLVFFFVFCDSRAWRGYSLRDKRVRQELPHLLGIHSLFLIVIGLLLTFVLSEQSLLPASWLVESGPKHESPFEVGLIFIGVAVVMTQAWIYRKILRRAAEAENTPIG